MMVVTNALGVAFTATLLSVGDSGATFVFPEDGATNTIAFSQLSKESAKSVCNAAGYVHIPPVIAATYALAKNDLARIDVLATDGRIAADVAKERKARVIRTFERISREKGISDEDIGKLKSSLKSGKR